MGVVGVVGSATAAGAAGIMLAAALWRYRELLLLDLGSEPVEDDASPPAMNGANGLRRSLKEPEWDRTSISSADWTGTAGRGVALSKLERRRDTPGMPKPGSGLPGYAWKGKAKLEGGALPESSCVWDMEDLLRLVFFGGSGGESESVSRVSIDESEPLL